MFPYIAADARHEIELQSYPSFHGISQTTQGCCCRCGRCCCCWDIVIGHLWSPSHYLFVLQTRSLRIRHMPMLRVPINSHQYIMHGATCSPLSVFKLPFTLPPLTTNTIPCLIVSLLPSIYHHMLHYCIWICYHHQPPSSVRWFHLKLNPSLSWNGR